MGLINPLWKQKWVPLYYYWQLLSRYVERHSHPPIIFHPRDTFRIFNIHSQDSNFRSIKERSESSSLPSCSTHLKPRINLLASQTSMSVHTPFLLLVLNTIHLPHHLKMTVPCTRTDRLSMKELVQTWTWQRIKEEGERSAMSRLSSSIKSPNYLNNTHFPTSCSLLTDTFFLSLQSLVLSFT